MGLVSYVMSYPYLFIGSTTVMTTGLVASAILLAAAGATPLRRTLAGRGAAALYGWIAPKLALALAYFGLGSLALATEILLRFHDINPLGTEIQFRSGLGHLVVALLGIAALLPRLRGLDLRTWVEAHFWALAYLTVQVLVLTPPWFEFQFQFDLVFAVARGMLAGALALNLALWCAAGGWRPGWAPRRRRAARISGS